MTSQLRHIGTILINCSVSCKDSAERQEFTTQAGNIYITASVNAMAELIMHRVERIFGRVVARQAEEKFFHRKFAI